MYENDRHCARVPVIQKLLQRIDDDDGDDDDDDSGGSDDGDDDDVNR